MSAIAYTALVNVYGQKHTILQGHLLQDSAVRLVRFLAARSDRGWFWGGRGALGAGGWCWARGAPRQQRGVQQSQGQLEPHSAEWDGPFFVVKIAVAWNDA